MVSDGQVKRSSHFVWKPKDTKAQKNDGDSSVSDMTNPAVGPVPSDFIDVGFTALEQDLNVLVSGSDSRTVPDAPEFYIPWHDRSILSDRQLSLEAWRGQHKPQLHIDIEHWVMYHMDRPGSYFPKETGFRHLLHCPNAVPQNNDC